MAPSLEQGQKIIMVPNNSTGLLHETNYIVLSVKDKRLIHKDDDNDGQHQHHGERHDDQLIEQLHVHLHEDDLE